MDEQISRMDAKFLEWMTGIAERWQWTLDDVAEHLDDEFTDIENRVAWYPRLALLLAREDWTVDEFGRVVKKCSSFSGRHDRGQLDDMLNHEQAARQAIIDLVQFYPESTSDIVHRIDNFVSLAVDLGFWNRSNNSADRARAGLLASLLLTALYPRKFVDFRQERWKAFAELLGYPGPPKGTSYGKKLVWAGELAGAIVQTPTFERYWLRHGEPFWVLAGLCIHGPEPEKPAILGETFPEGRIIESLHKRHERSRKVVELAKQKAFAKNSNLPCEVCSFSFVERYGEAGARIIEAHHKTPLSQLTGEVKTRVEDIALLCSNCHRMIHAGPRTLSVDELRQMVRSLAKE